MTIKEFEKYIRKNEEINFISFDEQCKNINLSKKVENKLNKEENFFDKSKTIIKILKKYKYVRKVYVNENVVSTRPQKEDLLIGYLISKSFDLKKLSFYVGYEKQDEIKIWNKISDIMCDLDESKDFFEDIGEKIDKNNEKYHDFMIDGESFKVVKS